MIDEVKVAVEQRLETLNEEFRVEAILKNSDANVAARVRRFAREARLADSTARERLVEVTRRTTAERERGVLGPTLTDVELLTKFNHDTVSLSLSLSLSTDGGGRGRAAPA